MKCPVIETVRQAEALGKALHDVVRFDPGWAARVFCGNPQFTYNTGPEVLNRELQSQWETYWTPAEKEAILVKFAMYRLM